MQILEDIQSVHLGVLILNKESGAVLYKNDFFRQFGSNEFSQLKSALNLSFGETCNNEITLDSGHIIGYSKYNIAGKRVLFLLNEISQKKIRNENRKFIANQNRLKDIIRELSHEIANPLSSVIMSLQVLEYGIKNYNDEEKLKYIKTSLKELKRLTLFLNDIKTSAAAKKIELKKSAINPVINNVVKSNKPLLDKKSLRIMNYISSSIKAVFDKAALHQVIFNLLHNSYEILQKNGKIEINIEKHHIFSEKYVKIIYRNNGPKLNPEEEKKIFIPSFTGRKNGSGLGMSIAKQLMIKMGGAIRISQPPDGWGVQFSIYLPAGNSKKLSDKKQDLSLDAFYSREKHLLF